MVTPKTENEKKDTESMVLLKIEPKIIPADTPLQEYQVSTTHWVEMKLEL